MKLPCSPSHFLGLALAILISSMGDAPGGDWPQFLGAGRDGRAAEEPDLVDDAPGGGFPVVWKREVGSGFAGPVVADGKVILFHREGDEAVVEAMETVGGERIWRAAYPSDYKDDFGFDPGPRSPATISGDGVFCYGAEGKITALELATGAIRWQVDAQEKYASPKGFFGRACAPLVVDGLVVVNVGGELAGGGGAGIVALDVNTGEQKWTATDQEASYSSPISREIGGKRVGIFFTRDGICGVELGTGSVGFEEAFRPETHPTVSAASPVDCGKNRFFFSAAYELGAGVWEVGDDAKKLNEVWKKQDALDCHYSTPIFAGGNLYGFHGRQERGQELRCISAGDGTVRWSEKMAPGNVVLAGEKLLVVTEDGELVIIHLTDEKYVELGRGQILRTGSRSYPALADGFLYARDPGRLICLDLRKK